MNKTNEKTAIQKMLFELQDTKYADFQSRLMPTIPKEIIIGVKNPLVKNLAKTISKEYPELVDDFLNQLPHTYYEESNLHIFLVAQIKDFDKSIAYTEKFLPFIDNWATCDCFKPKPFPKNTEKLLPYVKKWLTSTHTYTLRYAIDSLMTYYLDEYFAEEYMQLVANVKSEEYYVKMMAAWYFATAIAKQPKATMPYFMDKKLEKWVHNKAIQKAIESNRVSVELKQELRALKIK